MTLEKRNIPIDFSGELDTKTSPKKVMPGSFTLLQNAVRKKGKMFAKRPGSTVISAGVGHEALGVVDYKGQLVKFEDDQVLSRIDNYGTWQGKGSLISCVVTPENRIRGGISYYDIDSASLGDWSVYAYSHKPYDGVVDGYSGVRAAFYDDSSKSFYTTNYLLSATAGSPRCLAYGDYLHVFAVQNAGGGYGNLIHEAFPKSNPFPSTSATLANNLDDFGSLPVAPSYDVAQFPGSTDFMVLWGDKSASNIKLSRFTETGTHVSTTTIASERNHTACALVVTGTHIYCFWYYHVGSGSNHLRCKILDFALNTVVATFTVESVAHPYKWDTITGAPYTDNSGVHVFYGGGSQNYINARKISSGGSIDLKSLAIEDTRIRSRAFRRRVAGADSFFVCLENISEIQPTYFIVRHDKYVAASFKNSLARGLEYPYYTNPTLSMGSITDEAAGKFSFPAVVRDRVFVTDGTLESTSSIAKINVDFTQGFSCKKIGENLCIAGGKVAMYDGHNVVEQGFHLYPEEAVQSEHAAGGNLDKTKKYLGVLVYEWADMNGIIHRSAPSKPIVYSGTSTTYQAKVDLFYNPLQFTAKPGVATVLYRTIAGGLLFYRVSPIKLTPSSPEVLGTTIIDNVHDDDLKKNEPLYTTGNILESTSPPNATHIGEFSGRAILSGTEDGSVWFSKKTAERIPPQFSDFLKIPAPDGEPIKGTGVIDEKLILLREKGQPYFTYGDGPDNAGGGAFAQPIQMNTDGALKDAASIVNIPNQGLAFKHPQGLFQIGRNLQSFYFGAPVEDWNNTTIVGTAVDEEKSWVYFFTKEGPTLVFDYGWEEWYVFTISGVGCTMYQGAASDGKKVLAYVKANGDVYIANERIFKDASAHYTPKAIIGWLALAGISGFQRVYRAAFGGKFKALHTLKIGFGYDYKDTFDSEMSFDAASLGSDQYRIQSHLTTQKCEAIRFSIEADSTGKDSTIAQLLSDTSGTSGANPLDIDAQTFTAPEDGFITSVTVYMLKVVSTFGNVALSLYDTAAGLPSGNPIATSYSRLVSSFSTSAQAEVFEFKPVFVQKGKTYAFGYPKSQSEGMIGNAGSTLNPYAGGQWVRSTNGGASWTALADRDFQFSLVIQNTGEALEMDSLTLEVGLKRGMAKLRSGLKVPTT